MHESQLTRKKKNNGEKHWVIGYNKEKQKNYIIPGAISYNTKQFELAKTVITN